jgi:hypothetical protein
VVDRGVAVTEIDPVGASRDAWLPAIAPTAACRPHRSQREVGRLCGNSVCPPLAQPLVKVNYRPRGSTTKAPARDALPLFMEAV